MRLTIDIPENPTNGDVIKAIFPNADIEIHNITAYVIFDMRSNVIPFDLDWWKNPYDRVPYDEEDMRGAE